MTVRLLVGNVFDRLRALPANSFDVVVTSPPYWGLRNYDVEGQIGLEPTLGEHLDVMVRVFREVRRVLKAEGIVWLNYGDCYATAPNGKSAAEYKADGTDDRTFRDKPFSTVGPISPAKRVTSGVDRKDVDVGGWGSSDQSIRWRGGGMLKPKDLCMIPNRLAIALQDDGWWVRSEVIWHKPNPMPESVYDRPTTAHEKVWLLTKSEDYYWNAEAAREPVTDGAKPRKAVGPNSRESVDRVPVSRKIKVPGGWDVGKGAHGTINRAGRTEATYRDLPGVSPKSAPEGSNIKAKGSFHAAIGDTEFDLPAKAMPKETARDEQGLRSSSRMGGAPGWRKDTEKRPQTRNIRNVWSIAPKAFKEAHFATFPPALVEKCLMPAPVDVCGMCGRPANCGALCTHYGRAPTKVLDPFGGAGTTGLVASRRGFDCTLIELKPEYAEIARKRLQDAGVDVE